MAVSFKKAVREQIWLKVLLTGSSGSGKSYSALKLATGISSKSGSRIAYIGTEGSRDLYYAAEFDFDAIQLSEPFTVDSYIEAIDAAISANYNVLIIDTLSAEWNWLNTTHDKMSGNSFQNWGKLKPIHQKLIDKILYSPMHIICTARGKDEWVLEEDDKGRKVPKKVGLGAQQDKNITYDYTVSFNIDQSTHIATADKDNTHIFNNKYDALTEADGEALYAWANSSDIPATVHEAPKFEEAAITDEEKAAALKKEIVEKCKALGGSKNEAMMAKLKEYVPSGNPNSIRSIEKLQSLTVELDAIQPIA